MTLIERTLASAAMLGVMFSLERKTGVVGWGLGTVCAAIFAWVLRTQFDPLSELGLAVFLGYGTAAALLFLATFAVLPRVSATLKDSLER